MRIPVDDNLRLFSVLRPNRKQRGILKFVHDAKRTALNHRRQVLEKEVITHSNIEKGMRPFCRSLPRRWFYYKKTEYQLNHSKQKEQTL